MMRLGMRVWMSGLIVQAAWMAAPPAAVGQAGGRLMGELTRIHREAEGLKGALQFDKVEGLRQQRLQLLEQSVRNVPAAATKDEKAWIEDVVALQQADSLIQQLKYREAYDLARGRWARFAQADGKAPVHGDLAMMMAKAAESSLLVYPRRLGVKKAAEAEQILTEVKTALTAATTLDPCQIESQLVLAFLTQPNPREAFLRAEVRPSLQSRYKALLNLSHDPQAGGPVMPWHAPAEMLKADNTELVLRDFLLYRYLQGEGLRGMDAAGARFVLLRDLFLIEGADKRGRTGWFVASLAGTGDTPRWQRSHIYVLRRNLPAEDKVAAQGQPEGQKAPRGGPSQTAASPASHAREVIRVQLEAGKPLWSTKPTKEGYWIDLFATENMNAEHFIESGIPFLGVRASVSLKNAFGRVPQERKQTTPTEGRTRRTSSDQPRESRRSGDRDGSRQSGGSREGGARQSVRDRLQKQSTDAGSGSSAAADNTSVYVPVGNVTMFPGETGSASAEGTSGDLKVDLSAPAYDNLCIVVADSEPFEPAFFSEGDTRYLLLNDGNKLVFDAKTQSFVLDNGAVECVQPLSGASLPDPVVRKLVTLAAQSGSESLVAQLQKAGYSQQQATDEAVRAVRRPNYVPSRLGGGGSKDKEKDRSSSKDENRAFLAEAANLRTTRFLHGEADTFVILRPDIPTRNTVRSHGPRGGQGPAELFPQDGSSPFILLDPQGKTLESRYNAKDWQVLLNNVWGTFLPTAIRYRPVLPLILKHSRLPETFPVLSQGMSAPAQASGTATSVTFVPTEDEWREELAKSYLSASGSAVADLRGGGGSEGAGFRPFWAALWHRQAREEVVAKRYHRALVCFRDVIGLLGERALDEGFFDEVPTRERVGEFSRALAGYTADSRGAIIAEIEQAAALQRVGFTAASTFLMSRMIDRFELFTFPMLDEAAAYIQSYGFFPPQELSQVRRQLQDLIDQVRQSMPPSADLACVKEALEAKDAAETAGRLTALRDMLESKGSAAAGSVKTPAFIGGTLAAIYDNELSLATWLNLKSLLASASPGYLWRSAADSMARQIATNLVPVETYDPEEGFVARPVFTPGLSEALRQWAASGGRDKDPSAGLHYFVLAWYWMDRGVWQNAREAYKQSARVYLAQAARQGMGREAKDRKTAIQGLLAKRNFFGMVIAAAGITYDAPAGARTVGAAYARELGYQLTMWNRRWISVGLPESHGSREESYLRERIDTIGGTGREADEHTGHYFWFDYDMMPSVWRDALAVRIEAWKQQAAAQWKDNPAALAWLQNPAVVNWLKAPRPPGPPAPLPKDIQMSSLSLETAAREAQATFERPTTLDKRIVK